MNTNAPALTGPDGAFQPGAPSGPGLTLRDLIDRWHEASPDFERVAECADPDTAIWPGEATP